MTLVISGTPKTKATTPAFALTDEGKLEIYQN